MFTFGNESLAARQQSPESSSADSDSSRVLFPSPRRSFYKRCGFLPFHPFNVSLQHVHHQQSNTRVVCGVLPLHRPRVPPRYSCSGQESDAEEKISTSSNSRLKREIQSGCRHNNKAEEKKISGGRKKGSKFNLKCILSTELKEE